MTKKEGKWYILIHKKDEFHAANAITKYFTDNPFDTLVYGHSPLKFNDVNHISSYAQALQKTIYLSSQEQQDYTKLFTLSKVLYL
mmetsp:Transcript_16532/g.23499  ORF Transcript_16532/g.23499 Transcript_16532/m.23499 type:complete len:85 (-) Transcript_16532:110-364(-)|eukprot:CAMPEP_0184870620 /NCGR_PEP_ID=MMETSP0580-20130426/38196_1 /TAXON_ID=1118495 /ORGANISM="Dactyliosolen fragilissimus" /LENGTH=84 /DNA_ID=CAMNT_0027372807 /DNA_START=697 /DNA_END=948 /DNA_ORIENTATION=-